MLPIALFIHPTTRRFLFPLLYSSIDIVSTHAGHVVVDQDAVSANTYHRSSQSCALIIWSPDNTTYSTPRQDYVDV